MHPQQYQKPPPLNVLEHLTLVGVLGIALGVLCMSLYRIFRHIAHRNNTNFEQHGPQCTCLNCYEQYTVKFDSNQQIASILNSA